MKKAFERITDQAPRALRWEEMVEGGLRPSRRMRPLTAFLAGATAVVVVLGIVGLLRDSGDGQPIATPTTTTAPPPATTEETPPVSAGPITEMACGSLVAPYSTTIPDGEELGPEGEAAFEALQQSAEAALFIGYEVQLWGVDGNTIHLLGSPVSGGVDGYAYATLEKVDGEWVPVGFGQCHWQPVAPDGFGLATWELAEPSEPASHRVSVLANEVNCASGLPPDGREVLPVVIGDDAAVTITVLVESVVGGAECPSNPDFELQVDLGGALGGRILLDGSQVPPAVRHEGPRATCETLDWEGTTPNEIAVHFPCGDEDFQYQPVVRDHLPGMSPIESALRHLLAGPTEEERGSGFISWFGEGTADALISVSMTDGHLVADFNDGILVNNASTSSGSVGFNDEIRVNLFAFEEVDSIELRINGSCEAWSAYFEGEGCWIVTRQAYEEGTAPASP